MSQIQLLSSGRAPAAAPDTNALPHVLLIVDGFPKTLGGGERIVLRLASLLPQYGFRASILTFALHPEGSFKPEDAPCPLYLLPLKNTYGKDAWQGALALRRLLRDQEVRIVQTFFESSDLWAGAVTRATSKARLVWSRRDMGILRQGKHTTAYRLMRRLPHAVFAVSEKVAEHVKSTDGVPSSRVHVVYNGLDLGDAPGVSDRPSSPSTVVTTIGNVRRVKGHDLLVAAAARIKQQYPLVRFTIAGDVLEPDYFLELQAQVKELALEDNFQFLGKISDLSGHLASSDIFVLPSRSEGFSNALIEAMAAGLPSIATDVGGNAEAIRNGQSGLIVPPENAPALAEALASVLNSEELRSRLSEGGRHAVASNFTSDAMMTKVARLYRALLAE